jgi:hypothetical protein
MVIELSRRLFEGLTGTINNESSIDKCKDKGKQNYNFACILYGCETWSLTLREERKLKMFENRVLRRVFGPKKDEVTGNGENYKMRSLMICTANPILFGW